LIFLILDPQDEHFDRRLATHLVSLYHMSEADAEEKDVVSESIDNTFILPWIKLWLCYMNSISAVTGRSGFH